MHHRRIYKDDLRGGIEALNETDEFDNGMAVTTTYYL